MNKQEFKDKIKTIILQKYNKSIVDLDEPFEQSITLDYEKFPILTKFPELKSIITQLLTEQFDLFIQDIQWVSPRPTTFRIVFNNEELFYLIYLKGKWIAQISGKKYYLSNVGEEGRAVDSISKLLYFGKNEVEKDDIDMIDDKVKSNSGKTGRPKGSGAKVEPEDTKEPEIEL